MAKQILKDILIDADVISHFITGGQIFVLGKIFPNKIKILDKVYKELEAYKNKKKEIDNLLNLKLLEIIPFPNNNREIVKEYLHIKKLMMKGDGESACLAYVKFAGNIIGSSNLKDVKSYCNLHKIELLTTMDFLCEALKNKILSQAECNEFITRVLKAGSKLPVKKIEDFTCK